MVARILAVILAPGVGLGLVPIPGLVPGPGAGPLTTEGDARPGKDILSTVVFQVCL